MEFLYFLVTQDKTWGDAYGFHNHYFNELNIFTYSSIVMVVIGIVFSLAFYKGFCDCERNNLATRSNWWIMLAVTIVVAYLVSQFVFFGGANSGFIAESKTYLTTTLYTQYENNEKVYQECVNTFTEIKVNVQEGKDIAFWFDITNMLLAAILFFLTSLVVKKHTAHGTEIPF